VWGTLSDKIGRRKLLSAALVVEGLLLLVFIAALNSHSEPFIFVSLLAVAGIGHAAGNGIYPAFLVESLPPEVRYTAGSVGLQLAGVVGGFAPLAAVALEGSIFGIWSITLICLGICVGGAFAVQIMSRRRASVEQPVAVG
jgi:MFS family permease